MTDAKLKALVERLFDKAASNLTGTFIKPGRKPIKKGKLYELCCLVEILQLLNKAGYSVRAKTNTPNVLTFALAPASADKTKYSYFEADNGTDLLEIWVSVEISTLSHKLSGAMVASSTTAAVHELDVAV